MSGMLMNERFVAVFPSLVRLLGSLESAVILQHLHWATDEDGWIRITQQQISDETGITLRTVERRLRWLRDEGWVSAERSAAYDATLRYQIDTSRLAHSANLADSIPQPAKVADSDPANLADSSLQKERTTTRTGSEVDPVRHPSRQITKDAIRPEFIDHLAEKYAHANAESSYHRFYNFHFAKQDTSKSWEALLDNWVMNDSERAEATVLAGTDDRGIPLKQRRVSSVTPPPAQPGDPDYFTP